MTSASAIRAACVLACVGAALTAPSCGGGSVAWQRPVTAIAEPGPDEALCDFEGRWVGGALRSQQHGFPFVSVTTADIAAQLWRMESMPRMSATVDSAGFHFDGQVDLAQDDPVRAAETTQLADGVWVTAGAAVHVLAVRRNPRGSVEIAISPALASLPASTQFVAQPARLMSCAQLAITGRQHDAGALERQRAAIGISSVPTPGTLPAGSTVELSVAPGRPPFISFGPEPEALAVHVLETAFDRSRILYQRDGTLIVGWAPASAIVSGPAAPDAEELGRALAATRFELCHTTEQLELTVARDANIDHGGAIEAGAFFVREIALPDGSAIVRPIPTGAVDVPAGVSWLVRPSAPLTCATYDYRPGELPQHVVLQTLQIATTVRAATGIPSLRAGATCDGTLEHLLASPDRCRLQVACGDTVLLRDAGTDHHDAGFFECTFTAGSPPTITGNDTDTSQGTSDAAFAIDTAARTIVLDDDAAGPLGAFHVELRVTEITDAPSQEAP